MLTQNCDGHPLLSRFHKPDPKLPTDRQDKRSVVPIERSAWDQWLNGSIEEASALIQVPAGELFRHGAADPGQARRAGPVAPSGGRMPEPAGSAPAGHRG